MTAADDDARISTVLHLPTGRFAPGNPGRPRGSKNRISNEALAAVKSMKDDAIQQLREKIIAGDWTAIEFVLERILPKGRTVEMDGATAADVIAMLQSGEISAIEARDIATTLARLNEIGAIAELHERLAELEAAIAEKA